MNDITVTFIGGPADLSKRVISGGRRVEFPMFRARSEATYHVSEAPLPVEYSVFAYDIVPVYDRYGNRHFVGLPASAP